MGAYAPPTPDEVRALLAKAGLTRSAAAARLDCERRQVGRWCEGHSPLPYTTMAALLSLAFGRQPGPPADWRGPVSDLLQSAAESAE